MAKHNGKSAYLWKITILNPSKLRANRIQKKKQKSPLQRTN